MKVGTFWVVFSRTNLRCRIDLIVPQDREEFLIRSSHRLLVKENLSSHISFVEFLFTLQSTIIIGAYYTDGTADHGPDLMKNFVNEVLF